ncbi:hypothetical protein BDV96DRAFT_607188 [Lophiotrema nucula]|uniref:Uncharacterized protein n=1 Tax=Lophiotrema nucula TaxID=690887 RepID=A0A6A5YHJ1_9PLEO|nr:hypothetical protein BDV96DRAFT_607188 [Lophiotrema nucula]
MGRRETRRVPSFAPRKSKTETEPEEITICRGVLIMLFFSWGLLFLITAICFASDLLLRASQYPNPILGLLTFGSCFWICSLFVGCIEDWMDMVLDTSPKSKRPNRRTMSAGQALIYNIEEEMIKEAKMHMTW